MRATEHRKIISRGRIEILLEHANSILNCNLNLKSKFEKLDLKPDILVVQEGATTKFRNPRVLNGSVCSMRGFSSLYYIYVQIL